MIGHFSYRLHSFPILSRLNYTAYYFILLQANYTIYSCSLFDFKN
jgi:hypothetical protein